MSIPFVNSTNDYFQKDKHTLIINWGVVNDYLITQEYAIQEIGVYKKAYDYFIDYPQNFDGATMTEDLKDVFNLDLDAMLHDFFYIKYNVSSSYKYTQIADDIFYVETIRKGKSSWNAGARRMLLRLKSILGFSLYSKYIVKRVITEENITEFISDVSTLKKV